LYSNIPCKYLCCVFQSWDWGGEAVKKQILKKADLQLKKAEKMIKCKNDVVKKA